MKIALSLSIESHSVFMPFSCPKSPPSIHAFLHDVVVAGIGAVALANQICNEMIAGDFAWPAGMCMSFPLNTQRVRNVIYMS